MSPVPSVTTDHQNKLAGTAAENIGGEFVLRTGVSAASEKAFVVTWVAPLCM